MDKVTVLPANNGIFNIKFAVYSALNSNSYSCCTLENLFERKKIGIRTNVIKIYFKVIYLVYLYNKNIDYSIVNGYQMYLCLFSTLCFMDPAICQALETIC